MNKLLPAALPQTQKAKDRLQVSSTFRAGLVGIVDDSKSLKMAAQPFHRMAPVPPHLTYKPEVSTYMDHFRKPQQPLRRRPVMPPQMLLDSRRMPATSTSARKENIQPIKKKKMVNTTVKDYMDEMLRMTDKSFPSHNARVDVPCKSAQPNQRQRVDLRKISRSGYGISDTQARDIVRNDRSVDFYTQHKLAANNPTAAVKVKTPPARRSLSESKRTKDSCEPHWMTWNSGTPVPPGLQTRLHKPWPTPEPPKSPYSRPQSSVPRAVLNTLLPTKPTCPVPEMIGSEGINPTLTNAREQVFTPQPPALPASRPSSRKSNHPLAFFV